MIKHCVDFSLSPFGTEKFDCVNKKSEFLIFLLLIGSAATTGLRFLLLIISAIVSSRTTYTFLFPSWIVLIKISMNFLDIIRVFNRSLRVIIML